MLITGDVGGLVRLGLRWRDKINLVKADVEGEGEILTVLSTTGGAAATEVVDLAKISFKSSIRLRFNGAMLSSSSDSLSELVS